MILYGALQEWLWAVPPPGGYGKQPSARLGGNSKRK